MRFKNSIVIHKTNKFFRNLGFKQDPDCSYYCIRKGDVVICRDVDGNRYKTGLMVSVEPDLFFNAENGIVIKQRHAIKKRA